MTFTLEEIQKKVYDEYQKNGYLDMWISDYPECQNIFDIAELGLVDTETAEAKEIIRSPFYVGMNKDLAFECADIIIRVLNFMSRKGFNAEYYILEKNKKNLKRGKLHDKRI